MSPRPFFPSRLPLALFVAVFLLLALLAAGCAPRAGAPGEGRAVPPMSVSDFYGFCSALPVPGGCVSDPICLRFRRELASPPPDLAGCLAMCQQTENALYVANLTNGCGDILERAQDLCDQFCRRRAAR